MIHFWRYDFEIQAKKPKLAQGQQKCYKQCITVFVLPPFFLKGNYRMSTWKRGCKIEQDATGAYTLAPLQHSMWLLLFSCQARFSAIVFWNGWKRRLGGCLVYSSNFSRIFSSSPNSERAGLLRNIMHWDSSGKRKREWAALPWRTEKKKSSPFISQRLALATSCVRFACDLRVASLHIP